MVLLAEHSLNASTFAARVAIGAQADAYCGLVAAVGTLKGLVHGGANQKAMEAFLAIGAGAVFEVVYEIGKLIQRDIARRPMPLTVFFGVTLGMLMLYVTGLLIK